MTIKDYLLVIRQRLLVVLITVALTTASALVLTLRQAPEYEGKARLLVVPLPSQGSGGVLAKDQFQRSVATEAEIVKSAEVAKRVIKRLKLDQPPYILTPDELIDRVKIAAVIYTEVLDVTATAPDPVLAAAIANAFPEEYIALRRSQAVKEALEGSSEIGRNVSVLIDKLNEVESLIKVSTPDSARSDLLKRQAAEISDQITLQEATQRNLVDSSPLKNRGIGEIIQYAKPSGKRSNGDLARTGILGLIIGLPLALGLALLLDAMSDTIKSKEEAQRIVGVDNLGEIPLTPEWRSSKPYVVTREAPYSAAAEAFRTLRINLESKGNGSEPRRILITSPGMGEGKSTTSANLGVAFADAGRSALVISADLRRPKLHRMFGMEQGPGLSDVLLGNAEPKDVIQEASPNLYIMASGSLQDRADRLLTRGEMGAILDDISVVKTKGRRSKPRNDENGTAAQTNSGNTKTAVYAQPQITLIDSASVLGAAEVSAMVPAVDGVVLVLQAGITRREAATRAVEQIRRAGGTLLGFVLVGVRSEDDYSVYPPVDDSDMDQESENSTWSKVVGSLKN